MAATCFSTLFGKTASSPLLESHINDLFSTTSVKIAKPEVKSYPDTVYFNYHPIGLSFLFTPVGTYKPSGTPLTYDRLLLDSVDVFNIVKNAMPSKGKTFSQYPLLPLSLALPAAEPGSPSIFELKADTTGKELVKALGEPTRKGGGAGTSSGSIGIWCEWTILGIMVEFGGDEARGPQAWERGKDAVWKVITLFKPKDA